MLKIFSYTFEIQYVNGGVVSNNICNTFRLAIDNVFKDSCCSYDKMKCATCSGLVSCPYSHLYEHVLKWNAQQVINSSISPASPLVFTYLSDNNSVKNNEDIDCFNITIIDEERSYLEQFFNVITTLGESGVGRSRLQFILNKITDDSGATLYTNTDQTLGVPQNVQLECDGNISQESEFTINLRTPLKYNRRGCNAKVFYLEEFFDVLINRLNQLGSHYSKSFKLIDKGAILAIVKQIEITRHKLRWSERQSVRTKSKEFLIIDGFVGSVTCRGDYGALAPYLKVAEYIGVGKNINIGQGRLDVTKDGC